MINWAIVVIFILICVLQIFIGINVRKGRKTQEKLLELMKDDILRKARG